MVEKGKGEKSTRRPILTKMDDLQALMSKLHCFQQQVARMSEFEQIFSVCMNEDIEEGLNKKIFSVETTIKDELKEHKKLNTDKKLLLKNLQAETELKKTKLKAKLKLISSLEEELQHLSKEQQFLTEGPKDETINKRLEEEEAMSIKQLGLQINKVNGGWLQFVFTQINVQKPNVCFFISIGLDENRKYIVGDCQPEIIDMNQLLDKLNTTNSLNKFIHSVRKRFSRQVNK